MTKINWKDEPYRSAKLITGCEQKALELIELYKKISTLREPALCYTQVRFAAFD